MTVQVVMGTLTQWYVPELYRAFSSISHLRLGLASLRINFGYVSSPSVQAIVHNSTYSIVSKKNVMLVNIIVGSLYCHIRAID